ncbi:hypothetical protein DFR50_121104 [Roseiarcus fermentans]|uniref:Uncharacterized protein n=1 Tax=Roseiarcus fermentans TaxID=1473586 RepID=A0A366F536_9HYPH|nr:hypothetical protein DFR50_121104 [Roseiarcus fermentans]
MQTIGLAALIGLGLAASATAGEPVPADYQGVWAAARDCKGDFQTIREGSVDRRSTVCRVERVARSDAGPSAVTLTCGAGQSREIWRAETVDDTDFLVIARLQPETETGVAIELLERCPGIPIADIPLSEIPGNPVAAAASEARAVPHSPGRHRVRQHLHPHPQTGNTWKHSSQ